MFGLRRAKKKNSKKLAEDLRKFVAGEEIADTHRIECFVSKLEDGTTIPLAEISNDLPSWSDGEPLAWGSVVMAPAPKPEVTEPNVPEAPISNDLPEHTETIDNSESLKIEPEIDCKRKNREQIQKRLMKFDEQEKIDLALKEKEDFWINANRSF